MLLVQETFHIDGSHASSAGGHHGLAIAGVAHIASCKNSRDTGGTTRILYMNVALRIKFQLPVEKVGVGFMSDGDKETSNVDMLHFASLYIFKVGASNPIEVVAAYLLCYAVPEYFDFGVFEYLVLHGFGCTQLIAADYLVYFVA